ncbi:hypothetical protein KQX54_017698 [Cotesia glomerata]|uniref:Uncharacterized protein n=1 Tax=Cotesia glomerata TaxID=32391 RepID=A0AAV7I372_COTGL|nr:hypothetical protein KQX54_017698 [Cotesia glomerata]
MQSIMDGDSESKIVSTSQQQQQPCQNDITILQLQYYLLWLIGMEIRMYDTNEANLQFWSMASTDYLIMCYNLVKVMNADFGYFLSLQVIAGDENSEVFKTRCRMLYSYELMMDLEQKLESTDQCIKNVENTIIITTTNYL